MDSEIKIKCPYCSTIHIPEKNVLPGSLYETLCLSCHKTFKFRSLKSVRDYVQFSVNDKVYQLRNDTAVGISLNEFIRDSLGLKGTKAMCKEGGCGSCLVSATTLNLSNNKPFTFSLNSCLTPVLSCDGWQIKTIEGVGNRKLGYHPIQKTLAEKNGTQCGYCSPGMVMNMYSLLVESKTPSADIIERGFDGNICRCTGYRSILDAMKSFASDENISIDIEDLGKLHGQLNLCSEFSSGKKCDNCNGKCKDRKTVLLSLGCAVWQKPVSLEELYDMVDQYKVKKVRLVVGNTASGIYKHDGPYDAYIDTKGVKELYEVSVSDTISVGANISLSQFEFLLNEAGAKPEFAYCSVLAKHIRKVANVSVRNIGSWSGNLMTKFYHSEFPSDIFIILATAGVRLSIASKTETVDATLEEFMKTDMNGKIILKLTLFPWKENADKKNEFFTYKIMPRTQNAHAYVNAGFQATVDKTKFTIIGTPKILFGGISKDFVHASNTEKYLANKALFDQNVVSQTLRVCADEIVPDNNPVLASPKYRKNLAVALLYKFILNLIDEKLLPTIKSGMLNLERPLSSGKQDFDTDKTKWPLTEPMPKVTTLNQISGEAEYISDIPVSVNQLYAAFVISTIGRAKIKDIDPSEALKLPGVKKFISYKDIPVGGTNNFLPLQYDKINKEEIFCSGDVLYAGQGIGLIIADSQQIADDAALKVDVTYSDVQTPVTDIEEAIEKQMFFPKPADDITVGNPKSAISTSSVVVKGTVKMGTQYHFTLETQECLCVPKENVFEVYPSTQWPAGVQSAVAQALGIKSSTVAVHVRRIGGGYGSKLTRNMYVSAACSVAAYVMNGPVKLTLNLNTNMQMIGKRYPYLAQYEVGTTKSGKLNGVNITYFADHGCSASDSTVPAALDFADNVYFCENWHLSPVAVKTNTPSNTFCRSPSSVPGIFIMESIMEHVAVETGMTARDVKKLNLYVKGQKTPYGQPLPYCNISELVQQIEQSSEVDERMSAIQSFNKENRWKKKGLGFVPIKFGIQWVGNWFNVIVSVFGRDGSVAIIHGGIEMGQGINTKAIQMCAHELNIPMDIVTVRPTEDVSTANSMMSGGSITSEMCCYGVQQCCKELLERIAPVKTKMAGAKWEDIISQCYKEGVDLVARYFVHPTSDPNQPFFSYNTYGVSVAEVELDVLTGENQINRVDILYDCGESKNPDLDIGQIEGAVTMGIGYWLLEQTKYDPVSGKNLTSSTWEYKPPTTLDIPVDFRIQLLKNAPNPFKVIRSKAVAEPPLCMSSAILFALKMAISDARRESGNKDYFQAGPPTTVEVAQQLCLPDITQYVI